MPGTEIPSAGLVSTRIQAIVLFGIPSGSARTLLCIVTPYKSVLRNISLLNKQTNNKNAFKHYFKITSELSIRLFCLFVCLLVSSSRLSIQECGAIIYEFSICLWMGSLLSFGLDKPLVSQWASTAPGRGFADRGPPWKRMQDVLPLFPAHKIAPLLGALKQLNTAWNE